jgi:hypothetical protein
MFKLVTIDIPVVVTGTNMVGLPSFAAINIGDKVRFFLEQGKDGKVKPNGRPQLRITTYGEVGEEVGDIETVATIDHEEWDELEGEFKKGPAIVSVTGILQMDGDEVARVKAGAKSWIGGALIVNAYEVSVARPTTCTSEFRRVKAKVVASDVALD